MAARRMTYSFLQRFHTFEIWSDLDLEPLSLDDLKGNERKAFNWKASLVAYE